MEKCALLFFVMLYLKLFAKGQPDSWIGIDCGSNTGTSTNGIPWQTDTPFIKTGTNHPIPSNNLRALNILNTLRFFTAQNKNCYTLPSFTMARYFIRATFFYANYDSLSNPPTFDLQIDGNKWITVVSSLNETRYYEILYWSQKRNISVCLARTNVGQFPFISSLEAWPIPSSMYNGMSRDLAWLNSYRYNYGTDNEIIGYPGDMYNRIWEPISVPNAVNTTADPGTTIFDYSTEYPPGPAILDAIEAQNETTSIFLSFNPVKTFASIYIEGYFTEMNLLSTGSRSFHICVDGNCLETVTPDYEICTAEMILVQTVMSNLTVELRPTVNTLLPPIISAVEVYTASDPLITTGTNQNDLSGLVAFTSTFEQLEGWSGEPCLPTDTVWQWLGCSGSSGSNPPRVTSLNLSGYGLNGSLPNFSQMQALQDIDLSNNSLSGQIPEFIGQLPNLKKLNLSYNDFSGKLPSSIRDNERITYNIDGNPKLYGSSKNKSSTAMIIGLAIGIPLVAILLIMAIVYWIIRKRANQGPDQTTGPESGNGSGPEGFTPISASTGQLLGPTAPMQPIGEEDDEDYIPVSILDMNPNHVSMVPEMDLDELEGYIESRENEMISEDEDCVVVGEYEDNAFNDQSMVPDMDLEELDDIIRHENEKAKEISGGTVMSEKNHEDKS